MRFDMVRGLLRLISARLTLGAFLAPVFPNRHDLVDPSASLESRDG